LSSQLNTYLYSESNCATTKCSRLLSQPLQASPYKYTKCSGTCPLLFLVGLLRHLHGGPDIFLLHRVELLHWRSSRQLYRLRERVHTLYQELPHFIQPIQAVSKLNAPLPSAPSTTPKSEISLQFTLQQTVARERPGMAQRRTTCTPPTKGLLSLSTQARSCSANITADLLKSMWHLCLFRNGIPKMASSLS